MGKYVVLVEPLNREESQSPTTPSLVVNPRAISVFEDLSLQQGVPKYNEIDPTPIVAFVFPLFFGIMFGDVGHGITLLALGWYFFSRTKYTYWGKLLAVLGSSALVVGFVRGLFFGLEFASPIEHIIPLTQALSAGFTLQNLPLILELAIVIGTFHLGTAYSISLINEVRSGNYLEAFLNRMATLVLYSSIIPFGLAVAGTGLQLGVLYTSNASTTILLRAARSSDTGLDSRERLSSFHPWIFAYTSHQQTNCCIPILSQVKRSNKSNWLRSTPDSIEAVRILYQRT